MAHDAAFDLVRGHVDAGRLPQAVLGVADASGIRRLEAFGGVDVDETFLLFSITKALTGITAARAVERGLLTLDTPLHQALPEFRPADRGTAREMRLRHLVSHTAGIAEPLLDPPISLREELLTRGSDFAPGAASRYSTVAFEGVAALIEHATGQTWHDGIREWADPLGATGLTLEPESFQPVVGAAEGGVDIDRFVEVQSPGAGLAGRARDLLAIGSELLRIEGGASDGAVAPATLAMMRRPLTGDIPRLEPYPAERGQDWGFTFNLRNRAPGLIDRDVYGHAGWSGTEFWVHPSAGVCWVLLTATIQRDGVDADAIDNAVVSGR